MINWLDAPTVTESKTHTVIEQYWKIGGYHGYESIRVERTDDGCLHIDSRDDSATIPPHMLSLVIEAMQRLAA